MSILKTIPITLDLKRVGAQSQALPTLVEGDNGNVFVITMTDDGTPLDLSTATRVICVFSKTSDGRTVEQDTEDANVALEDYGVTVTGTPAANDTITVVKSSGTYTVTISSLGITDASVTDTGAFDDKFPDDGTYVFTYSGTSWMYGTHSVTISGADNNIVTVHLKSASYGAGTNNCEVQIYSGTGGDVLVTSANFNFKGRKGIMNDETLLAEEKYPILVSLITSVTAALNLAKPFTNPSVSITQLAPHATPTVSCTVGTDSVAWVFGVPEPNDIASIAFTGSHTPGTDDTMTITYSDGTQATHGIYNGADGTNGTNGVGITSITLVSGDHSPGSTDTYRVLLTDGNSYDFTVYNGADGAGQVTSVNNKTGAVTLTASDVGAVPTTRTVNSKALSADITLAASDVGAVPTTRTVNSKALSADISLTAADVGAVSKITKTSGFSVSWTASSKHSTDTNGVFPYKGTITITGVTSSMHAIVTFGVAHAVTGNYSPICETYNGGVYIWSKNNTTPTISSIVAYV